MDTIYALSSGQVPCGVAVVRVSGQAVSSIISQSGLGDLVPRKLILKSFLDRSGKLIDRGMVAYFPGPASFTGEDCLEFHVHGGRAVIMALYAHLDSFPGVRAAEPGEFTKTAFLNGKMDLTAAEGLADIIHAETAAQLSLANDEASGRLFDLYKGWMNTLLEQESLVTACIDFADEDDVSELMSATVSPALSNLRDTITTHLARKSVSRQIREGYRIAIIGEPNVGKSSLLNKLAGSERAIVSDIPGTTRDVVEVRLDINGRLVILADTAGMRDSDDILEMEGIRRSRLTAANSDLVIVVSDGGSFPALVLEGPTVPTLSVQSKSDLSSNADDFVDSDIRLSSKTGEGVDELLEMISVHMRTSMVTESDFLPIQQRHIAYLQRAIAELESACNPSLPLEMAAEHVRSSAVLIGKIVGRYDVEDVLGAIFSRFCIGK